MKSAGWHFMHGGREIWRATKREIARLAQQIADSTGQPVSVRPGRRAKAKPKLVDSRGRAKPARRVIRKTVRPNPDPMAYLGVWQEQEKGRAARQDYLKATKARRIGMSLRERGRSNRVAAQEAGAKKTAKFQVDAKRGRESLTLYRPNRSAAEDLAGQFMAAGYKVKVSEA